MALVARARLVRFLEILFLKPAIVVLRQLLDLIEEFSRPVVNCLHLAVQLRDLLLQQKLRLLILHLDLNYFGRFGILQFVHALTAHQLGCVLHLQLF